MTSALVLGGGGTVGIAYHAGVLRAIEDVAGFAPDSADLVVGTSAGSMVGAMMRSGVSAEHLYLASVGEHPDGALVDRGRSPWTALFSNPVDVARRAFGSMYVLQRAAIRLPVPPLPRFLRRVFPGGFYSIAEVEETLGAVVPREWPAKPLWLVTVDVRTGRRVILGRRNPPRCDLQTAVLASCAIPGFFQPIQVGNRTLVDGGVHSTTNLDLATKVRPDVILGVVPMGYDRGHRPGRVEAAIRDLSNRSLPAELAQARRADASVLLIQPGAADLAAFGGLDMMRPHGNEVVTKVAYASAVEQLSTPYATEVLDRLRETAAA